MAGPANLIKAQIKSILDQLVTDAVLGAVVEKDINTNILQTDFPSYPCAVLGTSNMIDSWEYQQTNRRIYEYVVLIVQLQDNLTDVANMEDLRDSVALKFNNNVTLGGTAPFGVSSVSSEIATIADAGKNFVLFNVTIRATTTVDLTYNF